MPVLQRTVLRNARIIDGTGGPSVEGDVLVEGDRIKAIGRIAHRDSDTVVDCSGRVLAPGFIDAHTHDDLALLQTPDMIPKVSQGVTCVVTGNCGVSIAPLVDTEPVPPLNLLGDKHAWVFPDFDSYAEALDKCPPAINSINLTGHSTLRVGVMDDLSRPARAKEIDRMCHIFDKALECGSSGLSTGLAYPPSINASTDEVVELARVAREHNRVYTTHMRDEEDDVVAAIEETLKIGRQAQIPTVISHHKVCGKVNWGRTVETLDLIRQARKTQQVTCDVYPYTASSTILLSSFVARAEKVMITWSESLPQFGSCYLDDIVAELDCGVDEAIERLQPAGAIYFQMCDEDVERVLSFSGAMIGSDGLPNDPHPHPRLWGTFPRVLGHYSRDLGLFSLAEAVHRMTGATAATFGIRDRGLLRQNYHADLVMFDPDSVRDLATYEEPARRAIGIEYVMVNGQCVYENGETTSSTPGRLLCAFA